MFKSINLEVLGDQGLVCENCERRVERMLRSLEGVSQVHAHSNNQQIEILFDAGKLDASEIIERLDRAGYKASVTKNTSV